MTTKQPATPLPRFTRNHQGRNHFSAPEDFGCYTCAEDYEEAQRQRREVIGEEMP